MLGVHLSGARHSRKEPPAAMLMCAQMGWVMLPPFFSTRLHSMTLSQEAWDSAPRSLSIPHAECMVVGHCQACTRAF